MPDPISLEHLMTILFQQFDHLPDHRTGQNSRYAIADAAKAAFAVFFTQSLSFLAHQRTMKQTKGRSNAETLFQMDQIPCDNQIRALLDPISPRQIFPAFDEVYRMLEQAGVLADFRVLDDQWLVSMDGTGYFTSKTIQCQNCLQRTSANEQTIYYHTAITPVLSSCASRIPIKFCMSGWPSWQLIRTLTISRFIIGMAALPKVMKSILVAIGFLPRLWHKMISLVYLC